MQTRQLGDSKFCKLSSISRHTTSKNFKIIQLESAETVKLFIAWLTSYQKKCWQHRWRYHKTTNCVPKGVSVNFADTCLVSSKHFKAIRSYKRVFTRRGWKAYQIALPFVQNFKTTDRFIKIYNASKGQTILLWDTLYK